MRRLFLGVAVVAATLGIVAGVRWGGLDEGDVLWPVAWAAWAPVGGLILLKRPRNGVGITMLLIGLLWGIAFLLIALTQSQVEFELKVWAELFSLLFGVLPWLGIIWLILVFPSARLSGRLERLTAVGLVAIGFFATLGFAVNSDPMEATGVASPLAQPQIEAVTSFVVEDSGFLLIVVLLIAAVVSLLRRWRASSGIERHQYRWLLLGAIVFAADLALGQVIPDDRLAPLLWVVAGAAIPVSIGIAVSRYRLYEIDRIISRTVSYALVVGVLAAAVASVAALAGAQFQEPWIVAATTLAVAAVFNPLRRRVQTLVDRRFNRSRYDAEQVIDQFVGSMREKVDPDGVVEGWLGVVADTMQPRSAAVWVRK